MSLKDRVVAAAPQQTTVSYVPNDTVVQKGEPGAITESGMPFRQVKNKVTYNNAVVTPLVRVGIYDGVISYEATQPITDNMGLTIPETTPGTWGQLYRAGRIY